MLVINIIQILENTEEQAVQYNPVLWHAWQLSRNAGDAKLEIGEVQIHVGAASGSDWLVIITIEIIPQVTKIYYLT